MTLILALIAIVLFVSAFKREDFTLLIVGALVTCLAFGSLIGGN